MQSLKPCRSIMQYFFNKKKTAKMFSAQIPHIRFPPEVNSEIAKFRNELVA